MGYTLTTPPQVLVLPPLVNSEIITNIGIATGISGIVTGIGTTDGSGTALALELHLYKEKFPWAEIGLSGHFMSDDGGIESGAVAVGATWLERHFTLDRTLRGTDQSASVEPEGLKNISKAVRNVVKALGKKQKSV